MEVCCGRLSATAAQVLLLLPLRRVAAQGEVGRGAFCVTRLCSVGAERRSIVHWSLVTPRWWVHGAAAMMTGATVPYFKRGTSGSRLEKYMGAGAWIRAKLICYMLHDAHRHFRLPGHLAAGFSPRCYARAGYSERDARRTGRQYVLVDDQRDVLYRDDRDDHNRGPTPWTCIEATSPEVLVRRYFEGDLQGANSVWPVVIVTLVHGPLMQAALDGRAEWWHRTAQQAHAILKQRLDDYLASWRFRALAGLLETLK